MDDGIDRRPGIYASVDIGSNSIRLYVGRFSAETLVPVHRALHSVRLGAGLDTTGRLSSERIKAAAETVADYMEQAARLGARWTWVFATEAIRSALNGADALQVMKSRAGQDIQVLSGEEEARLSYIGATRGLDANRDGAGDGLLVMDIGGGSTELGWAEDGRFLSLSIPLGAVRLTERFGGESGSLEHMVAEALSQAVEGGGRSRLPSTRESIGVGGTCTTLAAVDLGLREYLPEKVHGHRMNLERVRELARRLSNPEMVKDPVDGLHPDRADIIGAGATLAYVLLERMGAGSMTASEEDLMAGIIYDRLGS
ncbi:MAG: hypothetical protein HYY09_00400 [Firmicutes bacterium]|nr:hypothetical protein [Bacillota bacterium]